MNTNTSVPVVWAIRMGSLLHGMGDVSSNFRLEHPLQVFQRTQANSRVNKESKALEMDMYCHACK